MIESVFITFYWMPPKKKHREILKCHKFSKTGTPAKKEVYDYFTALSKQLTLRNREREQKKGVFLVSS